MKITLKQSYLAAFQILDEIFDDTQNEKLGNLLSGMNPYLFSDSMSADPATWHEWVSCATAVQGDGKLADNSIFETLVSFLRYNEKEYGYKSDLILKNIQGPSYQERWKKILEKASTLTDM